MYGIFTLCANEACLTDEDIKSIKTLLESTLEKIILTLSQTPLPSRVETDLFIKRSAIEFLVDDSHGFKLSREKFKPSITRLDYVIDRVSYIKKQCSHFEPNFYDSAGDSDIEDYGCSAMPRSHSWWFVFQENC